MSIESPFPGPNGREPQHYSFVNKKERRSNGCIHYLKVQQMFDVHIHHILRCSYQLHGSAMAYKSFQTFLILLNRDKKIYIAINTSPCVNISVSVLHDSSFRKNGFVLLLCKFSKNIFLCKILDITFSFCHQKEKVCKRKILVIEVFLL